jgi:transposase
MPSLVVPYARRTNRLASQQQKVAFVLGGEAGACLLATMGMAVSPDTLLRLIRKAPESEVKTPRVLGVDDWSKRKGHSYGTILVDLEAHKPVDLLPDRSAESFAKWLKEHTGVEIISRDRGVEYISGANEGAPDAIQVADRWHLLKNLRDALKQMLETRRACLKAAADRPDRDMAEQKNKESTSAMEEPSDAIRKLTKAEKRTLERRTRRQERYETVKELYQRGLSKSEIGRRLGLDFRTVAKYIRIDECPIYAGRRSGSSLLAPYMDYMTKRWEEGCHNATQIWREIRELGFGGARRTVGDWATKKRKSMESSVSDRMSKKIAPWSASRAAWLLVKQKEELTEDDKQALERMKEADEKITEAYDLGQRFTDMIRERRPESLPPWLEDVAKSRISALKGFAKGIKQDLAAVTNALSLPWSNGQTEGQVNRLKLIKRQMYGRANFDLLRKRVIGGPVIWNPG